MSVIVCDPSAEGQTRHSDFAVLEWIEVSRFMKDADCDRHFFDLVGPPDQCL
jgi:hypothetical protein